MDEFDKIIAANYSLYERMKTMHPEDYPGNGLPDVLEPPLVRLYCTGCKSAWDAWVDDDGSLQDPRDAKCACEHGGYVIVAPDDDGS